MTKPLVLCIMDGVGIGTNMAHNAVCIAHMPCFTHLLKTYPCSSLRASGVAVGLPEGTMGNSEVGHITIGAGRVVNQFLRRFDMENWDDNSALRDFIAYLHTTGGVAHMAGLMSDGRVHSDVSEIIVIAQRIASTGGRVCIHFIADGRDTLPRSAEKYADMITDALAEYIADGRVFFGSVSGRYYAMDRNQNMDRTQAAYDAIVLGRAQYHAPGIVAAINDAYARGETDEFITPTVIDGAPAISDGDGFVFCNYRSDRARQIVRAVAGRGVRMLCFSQYGEGLDEICPALLPDEKITNTLGDVLAAAGLRQLRIAETEKYNHVTYFFDAERTMDYSNGEKVLIPSPAVATFDLAPQMAAREITDALLDRLDNFDVVILNYANGDMVGHTGIEDATIKALEFLDTQLARLVPAVLQRDGTLLVTADHGNAECMWDDKHNAPWTAHTTNPVNFIVVSNMPHVVHDGALADIAPTVLKLLGLPVPVEMTGKSLVD